MRVICPVMRFTQVPWIFSFSFSNPSNQLIIGLFSKAIRLSLYCAWYIRGQVIYRIRRFNYYLRLRWAIDLIRYTHFSKMDFQFELRLPRVQYSRDLTLDPSLEEQKTGTHSPMLSVILPFAKDEFVVTDSWFQTHDWTNAARFQLVARVQLIHGVSKIN